MNNEVSKPEELCIGLAIHAFNFVDFTVYFNHMHAFCSWARQHKLVFIGKKGCDSATAREFIADKAVETNCTHLLFVDADHIIPVEMLNLLLENKNECMVSGLCCKKGDGFKQVVFGKSPDGRFLELNLPIDGKVYEVAVCAFGCTLINLKELQKLPKPWFRDTCETTCDGSLQNARSDVNLCEAFRKIGGKVFVDTRILIGHYGHDQMNCVFPQNAKVLSNLQQLYQDSVNLNKGIEGVYGDVL